MLQKTIMVVSTLEGIDMTAREAYEADIKGYTDLCRCGGAGEKFAQTVTGAGAHLISHCDDGIRWAEQVAAEDGIEATAELYHRGREASIAIHCPRGCFNIGGY